MIVQEKSAPMREVSDGIGHDARVDIADAVLAEVGERQRLKMLEGCVSQILVQPDLQPQRVARREIVGHACKEDHADIDQNKGQDRVERSEPDEMVERIALQERRADIDRAAAHREHNHRGHHAAVLFQIRQHFANAEELQPARLFGGLFHTFASFAVPDWIS